MIYTHKKQRLLYEQNRKRERQYEAKRKHTYGLDSRSFASNEHFNMVLFFLHAINAIEDKWSSSGEVVRNSSCSYSLWMDFYAGLKLRNPFHSSVMSQMLVLGLLD
ncbi:hypothetical protein MAM1_0001c00108 [Mucor ambiguus]|uniref:Uncharacterized protein n=1 Tax=Mucor ambiguus TaxID=91626 RepID=A0A0C9LZK1_9FUNG|nr:hypothetical protein MAM1_0001c00108 [Mucor ambiguus]